MDDDSPYAFEAQLLKTLGIVSGDGDGSLRPDDNLSRAEFAKLCGLYARQTEGGRVKLRFEYIQRRLRGPLGAPLHQLCVKNQIILGYPDGTFHPDETISFAQAVTVTLRTLGYNAAEIGASGRIIISKGSEPRPDGRYALCR